MTLRELRKLTTERILVKTVDTDGQEIYREYHRAVREDWRITHISAKRTMTGTALIVEIEDEEGK